MTVFVLPAVGCVNFDDSRDVYCQTAKPAMRAQVCQNGPQVVTFEPANNAVGVALDAGLKVTFNQEILCGLGSIQLVPNTAGGTELAGVLTCNAAVATFTPAKPMESGRVYKATLNETITNDAGTPTRSTSWMFTTR